MRDCVINCCRPSRTRCTTVMLVLFLGLLKPLFALNDCKHSTSLRFLCSTDGKAALVALTKELIDLRSLDHAANVTSFDVQSIDEQLKERDDYPDPQLMVLLSDTMCLFNAIPWQIRLSEIFRMNCSNLRHHSTLSQLESDVKRELINVINRFGNCEQRFGK